MTRALRAGLGLLFIALSMCVVTGWSVDAHARDDASLSYHTITTPHFYVHYFDGRAALARRSAYLAEEAHEVMSPLLAWTPAGRTHMIIEDQIDTANGSANVYGRNVIRIFGMPPESDSVLGYYDDWLRILIYHEYVHILHLDTISGLAPWINAVIGKQINPNQTMPRWYIEGLAVHYESARTGTGRIHSALYQMWLRAEALGGKLFNLGQVTGSPAQWPFGSAAYLYGSAFVRWMADRHGEEFLKRFNHLYGGRLIPLSMNQAARTLSGETFDQMWTLWTTETKARAHAQAIAMGIQGFSPLNPVTTEGGRTAYPVLRPKHNAITILRQDLKSEVMITDIHTTTNARAPLFESPVAEGPGAWDPSGRFWIYGRTTQHKSVYQFHDLFSWDSKTKRSIQLTQGERAREPSISPDGRWLTYVRVVDGTMQLVLRAFDQNGPAGPRRILVDGTKWSWDNERHWQQIATPTWTADSRSIVFSWWRSDVRRRDLWKVTPHTDAPPTLNALTQDAAMDLQPHVAADGYLYFSSDRSGVYNIHRMDLTTGRAQRVTNVMYGVFSPAMSQDKKWLYVTSYGPTGYDISRLSTGALRPYATHSMPAREPVRTYPVPRMDLWEESEYEPHRWLRPLFFSPDMAVLTSGLGIAGTVSGSDPVGRHAYQLSAGAVQGTPEGGWRPSVALSYNYGGLPITMSMSGSYNRYLNTNSLFAESRFIPYLEQRTTGSVAISYPMTNFIESLSLNMSYAVDYRTYADEVAVDPEPGDLEPFEAGSGWRNNLTFGVRLSNIEQFSYSISVEKGLDLSASMSIEVPELGSDYEVLTARWGARGFLPIPWLEYHVLSAGAYGGHIVSAENRVGQWGMGGPSPQNFLNSAVFQTPTGGFNVRGYAPGLQAGTSYFWGNLSYRFPLLDLEQGFSTVPVYFRRLKGQAFLDAGTAYTGFLGDAPVLYGVGAELEVDSLFFYYLGGAIRLGYAYGLDEELGGHDVYLRFGGGF